MRLRAEIAASRMNWRKAQQDDRRPAGTIPHCFCDDNTFAPTATMPILKGHYRHLIDKDGQVQIPEPIREAAGTDWYAASRGFAECVFLYPEGEWAEIESQVDELNPATREARDFYRIVLMWAYDAEASEDGHVRLPPPLCDFAGLEGEVEILGAYDHIEIWDPGRLRTFIEKQPSYQDLVTALR